MKRFLRLAALLCCLALLPLSVFGEEAAAPAPTIRVLLRRLNLTDRIDLRLGCGILAAWNGGRMQIPAGSEVTVQVRQDRLILFYRGAALDCGSDLNLVRERSVSGSSLPGLTLLLQQLGQRLFVDPISDILRLIDDPFPDEPCGQLHKLALFGFVVK